MGALAKLFHCSDKILDTFFLNLLPELLRFIVLAIYVLTKHCKHLSSSHKYRSMINKKSLKFAYRVRAKEEECNICLSEFGEGDVARELLDCRHVFHSHCLEKWLQAAATCPLCRSLVVPEVVVEEYHQMQIERENDGGVEKELALILFKALHGGGCYGLV